MTQLGYYTGTPAQQRTTFTSLPLITCGQNIQQPDSVPVSSSFSHER